MQEPPPPFDSFAWLAIPLVLAVIFGSKKRPIARKILLTLLDRCRSSDIMRHTKKGGGSGLNPLGMVSPEYIDPEIRI
jgi:hypothetical protein